MKVTQNLWQCTFFFMSRYSTNLITTSSDTFFFLLINGMAVDMVLYAKKARSKGALAWRALFMATGWDVGDVFPTRHPNRWQEHHFVPAISVALCGQNPAKLIRLMMSHPNLKMNKSWYMWLSGVLKRALLGGCWKVRNCPSLSILKKQRLEALPRLCILNLSLFNEVPGGWESANCLPALGLRSTIRNDYFLPYFYQWYLYVTFLFIFW